ncbi:hypothetical protein CCACVL1_17857 [Corchorus capsularis]|uniref:Uncharacterized protein n=1 Tax=Corchorus capsularis TaxID=210143 RepID=A0A1R3HPK3_COCAP|nr:hypothetical protein CCACVL1_17857 [Corchorus capsularis]
MDAIDFVFLRHWAGEDAWHILA